MTQKQSKMNCSFSLWAGYGAALWALAFAVFHFLWAMGWYVGLPDEESQKAFHQTWFKIYNLVVAVLCVVAIFLGLALTSVLWRRLSKRLISNAGWCVTVLLMLRGLAGVLQFIYLVIIGKNVIDPMVLWEFWFCLGAALFCISTYKFNRKCI